MLKKGIIFKNFPLEEMLKDLSSRTWEEESDDMYLLEKGFKKGHGYYYLSLQLICMLGRILKAFRRNRLPSITPKKRKVPNGILLAVTRIH